jgi:hypothetical protein
MYVILAFWQNSRIKKSHLTKKIKQMGIPNNPSSLVRIHLFEDLNLVIVGLNFELAIKEGANALLSEE